jgi:hypothetical protein
VPPAFCCNRFTHPIWDDRKVITSFLAQRHPYFNRALSISFIGTYFHRSLHILECRLSLRPMVLQLRPLSWHQGHHASTTTASSCFPHHTFSFHVIYSLHSAFRWMATSKRPLVASRLPRVRHRCFISLSVRHSSFYKTFSSSFPLDSLEEVFNSCSAKSPLLAFVILCNPCPQP